ncbi:glycoside hydrolase family 88/105 protein [Flavicella sediminum]|uniref:glycoside hydrolase family 88/105 protein n=1 Tax=Flavicella sediminum TaxID=2585141 RepID=UPI00111E66F7|nr:glycoside hydrolase family 88 protein [Flavicella sediminum]
MKRKLLLVFALIWMPAVVCAQAIKPEQVKNEMKRVADWQIENFKENYSGRKKPHHIADWTNGALYVGMEKWAAIAGDEKYYEWLKGIGEEQQWNLHFRKYHADDHTIGQLYCQLFRKYGDKEMLKSTQKQLDFIIYHPSQSKLNWKTPFHQDRWNWCDALFMSPPVFAQMYKITGKQVYLDFMVSEYKATTDFLFDRKECLYYRDERFENQLDHGTKIFWSRGNGWVFAGLVNILNELDPKQKEYKYFLKIYKKMAKKLLKIQSEKGHWAMSLLGDEFYPTPETSGTSFFTYGLAWGINNEILDRDSYEPAVQKAWTALTGYITSEGMLGYVQPIGAAPGQAWEDKTEVYGTGAFLCAGSELLKLYAK